MKETQRDPQIMNVKLLGLKALNYVIFFSFPMVPPVQKTELELS